MKVSDIIHQKRYTDKVKSLELKTFGFSSISNDEQMILNTYSTLESQKINSIDTMYTKLEGLKTKTFEKDIKLNTSIH